MVRAGRGKIWLCELGGIRTLNRRGNQYRNTATRRAGSEDMDFADKKRVVKYMESLGYECYTNMFLLVPKDIEKEGQYKITESVSEVMILQWKVAARPDVTCWKVDESKSKPPPLFIEIDGSVHKKELDRRDLYAALGIEHIVINKEYLAKDNVTWESWIDVHLEDDN